MIRRGNKYRAKRTALFPGGKLYDSTAERDRAAELRLLAHAGEIADIDEQVRVHLTAGITWKIDFRYEEHGRTVYEDVKGVWSREARLKRRLWKQFGPGVLRITRRRGRKSGFMVVEEIVPLQAMQEERR